MTGTSQVELDIARDRHGKFEPQLIAPVAPNCAEFKSFANRWRLLSCFPYFNVRIVNKEAFMATATLTTKGQITIPVEVRTSLGVDAGDRVEFVEVAPGRYEFIAATRPVTALKGMFGKPRKAVSIDDMNAAIARRGAAAK
jgi:AbrB family looped-hinge helix DNA binding protein